MSDFTNISHPVARKQHSCDYCSRIIKPGEIYHTIASNSDIGFRSEKICGECFGMMGDYIGENEGFNICRDGFSEWLRKAFCAECGQFINCECKAPQQCEKIKRAYERSAK